MKSPSGERSLGDCSLAELEAQITELAGQLNAANYRWLTLQARAGDVSAEMPYWSLS